MKKKITVALMAVLVAMAAHAFDIPSRPSPAKFVNDLAGILKADQVEALEDTLKNFSIATTNQIVVTSVPEMDGDLKMWGAEMIDKWGIGQKGLDNGVLILIKPKTKEQKGEFAILPGRGLGGALPDAFCKKTIENKAIPCLKNGNDYMGAVWAVLNVVMPVCAGEVPEEGADSGDDDGGSSLWWLGGIAAFLVGATWYSNRKQKQKLANETPEERAERLKKAEELRKKREAERVTDRLKKRTGAVFHLNDDDDDDDDKDDDEEFGGGTSDGGGASSSW